MISYPLLELLLKTNKQYLIPEDYKKKLLKHIDGFHMEITKIEGKLKLGQNLAPMTKTVCWMNY